MATDSPASSDPFVLQADGPAEQPAAEAEASGGASASAGFDLDALVALSFGPLKGVLAHLLERMERQEAAIAKLTVAEPADGADGKAETDELNAEARLSLIERRLGLDGTGLDGDDASTIPLLERVRSLEGFCGLGADGSGADGTVSVDGAAGPGGLVGLEGRVSVTESKIGSGTDGDGGSTLFERLMGLQARVDELEAASSGSAGASAGDSADGSSGDGKAVSRAEFEALDKRETDSEARIEALEKAVANAQRTANEAKQTADRAAEGADGLGRAVRELGDHSAQIATEESLGGVSPADGSVGRLRSSRRLGSGKLSRPLSGKSSPGRASDGEVAEVLGSMRPGSGSGTAKQALDEALAARAAADKAGSEAADALDRLGRLADDLAALKKDAAADREAAKEEREGARRRAEEAAAEADARRKRLAEAAAASSADGGSQGGGGAGADEIAAALGSIDQVAAAQRRMQGELERLAKAAERAGETADQAATAARNAQRSAAAASMAAGGSESKGEDDGALGGDGGVGPAAARSMAAATAVSLGLLTGLARASAGTAGVPQERVEELAGPADGAVESLKALVSSLEEEALVGGSPAGSGAGIGGGGDGAAGAAGTGGASGSGVAGSGAQGADGKLSWSTASVLSAVSQASAEVGTALDRLLEETGPLAQAKAGQSDMAALRRLIGHVESEVGRAHGSVRELRQRTEEQVAALLTGAGGAPPASAASAAGAGPGGAGIGGAGGFGDAEATDEEVAALWDALAQKADVSEIRGLASLDALRSKVDRRELARLKGLLDKLWRHVEAQGKGPNRTGDFAFLSGKPLKDYRCLSCGTQLEGMTEPPTFHIPSSAMPPGSLRRRSPQPPSRGPSPVLGGAQSVVLPNGTVVRRPGPLHASAAAAAGDDPRSTGGTPNRRPPSAKRRTALKRQSDSATATGGNTASTSALHPIDGLTLPAIA